jgi:hypothetical protein
LLLGLSHHGQAGHALAGARLANDAERASAFDRETQAVDGLDQPVVGAEVHSKITDVEEGVALLRYRWQIAQHGLGHGRSS